MPISVIPFKMPAPLEIPAHLVSMLRQLPPDQAVVRGMELLLQIDAAEVLLYERVDPAGILAIGGVVCREADRAAEVQGLLRQEEVYGKPLSPEGLAGRAFAQNSALLVMGQVQPGEKVQVPARLKDLLLGGAPGGNIGFVYVLPLAGQDKRPAGALTLIRPATAGPLNHEQPNIAEGMRQVLSRILSGG